MAWIVVQVAFLAKAGDLPRPFSSFLLLPAAEIVLEQSESVTDRASWRFWAVQAGMVGEEP